MGGGKAPKGFKLWKGQFVEGEGHGETEPAELGSSAFGACPRLALFSVFGAFAESMLKTS